MNFEELLGNKKLVMILTYLIDNKDVIQRELIEKRKISKATAVKWNKYLIKNNLIQKKKIGQTSILNLNHDNIVIKELKKTKILLELEDLKKIKAEVYLYGSCARGDYHKDSDIDILIIGNLKRNQIIRDIENLSKRLKRSINFKIFTHLEWSKMYTKDKVFYERVEKDKVRLS